MTAKEFIRENREQMLRDLRKLVAVPSVTVEGSTKAGEPFGEENAKVLRVFTDLSSSMGFSARNFDGYAADATLGSGSRMIGFLAHLDVVAAGEGWNTPPFAVTVKDGLMYGRGVADDKGPVVAALYAMRYLKEENLLPPDTCVRLVVGADEEVGMRCVPYYTAHAERLPECTMIVDGNFPVVNTEKGLLDFDLKYDPEPEEDWQAEIASIEGGSARNIVPGFARCVLSVKPEEKKDVEQKLDRLCRSRGMENLRVSREGDSCTVTAKGVAIHAMTPDKGVNAVSLLLHGLLLSGVRFREQRFLEAYEKLIGLTCLGEKFNCVWSDEISGRFTFNIGGIRRRGSVFVMEANARYPISRTFEELDREMLHRFTDAGFSYDTILSLKPLNIPEDSPFVQKLLHAYREVSGDTVSGVISMGGASYARLFPNAVSFGPLFPSDRDLAHEANEEYRLDSFEKALEVYITALQELLKG